MNFYLNLLLSFCIGLSVVNCTKAELPDNSNITTKPFKITIEALQSVTPKHHFGILTDNYLQMYAWLNNNEGKYSVDNSLYNWVCFPKAKILTLYCRNFGPDPSDGIDYSELEFDVIQDGVKYTIGMRRALEFSVCKRHIAKWQELMKNQDHVCVGGHPGKLKSNNGKNERLWTFELFVTKNGCASYFQGYCDIEYWKKYGFPDLAKSNYEHKY